MDVRGGGVNRRQSFCMETFASFEVLFKGGAGESIFLTKHCGISIAGRKKASSEAFLR